MKGHSADSLLISMADVCVCHLARSLAALPPQQGHASINGGPAAGPAAQRQFSEADLPALKMCTRQNGTRHALGGERTGQVITQASWEHPKL